MKHLQAFGAELNGEEIEEMYRKADRDGSNDVDEDELAACLTASHGDGEISKVSRICNTVHSTSSRVLGTIPSQLTVISVPDRLPLAAAGSAR